MPKRQRSYCNRVSTCIRLVRAISRSFGRWGTPRGVHWRCISELDVQNALDVVRCMLADHPAALYVMARMSAGAVGQCAQSGHTDSRAAHRIRHNVRCANRTPDRRLPPAGSIRTLLSSGDLPERSGCHLAPPAGLRRHRSHVVSPRRSGQSHCRSLVAKWSMLSLCNAHLASSATAHPLTLHMRSNATSALPLAHSHLRTPTCTSSCGCRRNTTCALEHSRERFGF